RPRDRAYQLGAFGQGEGAEVPSIDIEDDDRSGSAVAALETPRDIDRKALQTGNLVALGRQHPATGPQRLCSLTIGQNFPRWIAANKAQVMSSVGRVLQRLEPMPLEIGDEDVLAVRSPLEVVPI